MPLLRSGSYGHRVSLCGIAGTYRISWTYDVKHRRIRYPRWCYRLTDLAGAKRFAKKWGCVVPPDVI